MNHLEKAHKTICALVKDFQGHEKRYLSSDYSEAQARLDFIDKFFTALGWDVNHAEQKNPYEQEVKVEKGVNVARAQKRADYAFCLAPNFRDAKFFVEAKKPSKGLANPDDYFQTARYGWNAGAPLCVLTDFEELHIIDCRFKPSIDTALKLCHKKFHYSEYVDAGKFAEIYWLFSREAIANNAIEKLVETLKKPTGKAVQRGLFPGGFQPIDEAFLEEIDEIRKTLAKAFKKNVPEMYSAELTEAVQKTIDRLVFIRFLEDKLIEPEYLLDNIGQTGNAWAEFIAICRKLDKKYNGIVFKEISIDLMGFEGPVDTEFRDICEELSRQNTPYDFNYIPIHIIGSIYERFLGKEVHATAKRVDIEEKPEVRKAGGVYYTPQYIVRYIVGNTIGKLIEGKTPEEIAKLRFADIACGSGSFLIGAFDLLLEYHSKYYQAHPEKAKKDGCYHKEGKWVLSIKQKRNILLNNIYGVDIDSQAVEVTQLSLALKMLEDETTATANEMQVLYHDTVLPDLTKNIVCGNSLIGMDILQGDLFELGSEEERKLKPMDIESILQVQKKNGGFDALIGNPPYNAELIKKEMKYLKSKYITVHTGRIDTAAIFIEKGIKMTNGLLMYLLPYRLLSRKRNHAGFQKWLQQNTNIEKVLYLGTIKEIKANDEFMVMQLNKQCSNDNVINVSPKTVKEDIINNKIKFYKIEQNKWGPPNYDMNIRLGLFNIDLLNKIKAKAIVLGDIAECRDGIVPFIRDKLVSLKQIDKRYKPLLGIRGYYKLDKYSLHWGGTYICYDFNEAKKYIKQKKELRKVQLRDESIFLHSEKILTAQDSTVIKGTLDTNNYYTTNSIHTTYLKPNNNGYNIRYILALMNSKLLNYYHQSIVLKGQDLHPQILVTNLPKLPIYEILFTKKTEKYKHDNIVKLCEQILDGYKSIESAKTEADKNYYQQKCQSLDNQIDKLVYELYGLTEEEIKVVEGT